MVADNLPPRRAEDIRIQAWLTERLAVLHYERHGLWPRLRRFLFGNRLVRWLRFQPRRSEDAVVTVGDGRKALGPGSQRINLLNPPELIDAAGYPTKV